MHDPFADWPLLDRVAFAQCEIRLGNVEALRGTLNDNLKRFPAEMANRPWAEVRPLATGILVEADACQTEYRRIPEELERIFIPDSSKDHAQMMIAHCRAVKAIIDLAKSTIELIIQEGDLSSEP